MKPTIGRIVHYKLSQNDADQINRRRDFAASVSANAGFPTHLGNHAEAGQVFPAQIVRVFDPTGDYGTCNLQVSLDGNDTFWATSRKTGDEEGAWSWPPRA